MNVAPPDESVKMRVTQVLAELGETVAADATIGRTLDGDDFESIGAELPLVSLDDTALARSVPIRSTSSARKPDLQLVSLLGEGGMGAVYAARQRALNREVAVKRLRAVDPSGNAKKSLLVEARVMGALEHPNIVPVHALGCDEDGMPVLVMKRIEGVSWRVLLEDPNHPKWTEIGDPKERGIPFHVRVLVSICNALRFAHDRGVIHRDIKPENVMIGAFGEVYLLDWGVARSVASQADAQVVGTPAYMAPEMVADPASADVQTDVYLLGAMLHEILTGHVMHRGRSLTELLVAVMMARPREREEFEETLPAVLVDLCIAATHPDRSVRTPSVAKFAEALAHYATHRASQEIAASAIEKLHEAERRVRADDAALVAGDVGVLLGESRFGLEQSLRQWSENADARRGLQRCLERSCDRELRLRNVAAARALVDGLPEKRPELSARVARLEREMDEARRAAEENERREREMDSTVSAVPRLLFLAAFMLVGVGASTAAYLEEQRTGQMMSMREQAQLDGSILAFFTIGMLLGRRRLLTNAFNRNTWALWYVAVVAVTISDLYLGHVGVSSQAATPSGFGIVAVVFTVGAFTVSRSLALVALSMWTTSILSAAFPPQATLIATIGLFFTICVNMEITRRVAHRPRSVKGGRQES